MCFGVQFSFLRSMQTYSLDNWMPHCFSSLPCILAAVISGFWAIHMLMNCMWILLTFVCSGRLGFLLSWTHPVVSKRIINRRTLCLVVLNWCLSWRVLEKSQVLLMEHLIGDIRSWARITFLYASYMYIQQSESPSFEILRILNDQYKEVCKLLADVSRRWLFHILVTRAETSLWLRFLWS